VRGPGAGLRGMRIRGKIQVRIKNKIKIKIKDKIKAERRARIWIKAAMRSGGGRR
jgi:hypothetical protein